MTPPTPSEALRQLLRDLPAIVAVESIDRIWIFSPRENAGKESGLLVLSLLEGEDSDQRVLATLRYDAERRKDGLRRTDDLTEQGRAPADRIPPLIDGVLRRMPDAAEDPIMHEVRGDAERWAVLLESIGVLPVDRATGE